MLIAPGAAGFKATRDVLNFLHVAHASPLTKLFAVTGYSFWRFCSV
jgi:hypothetical protein